MKKNYLLALSIILISISLVGFTFYVSPSEKKFLLAWNTTQSFFKSLDLYDQKTKKQEAARALKFWSQVKTSDFKAINNQVFEMAADVSKAFLSGDKGTKTQALILQMQQHHNNSNKSAQQDWLTFQNTLGASYYYLDSICFWLSGDSTSVIKRSPIYREQPIIDYTQLKARQKEFIGAQNARDNRNDTSLINLIIQQSQFITDSTIIDKQSYELKKNQLKSESDRLIQRLKSWANNNRQLPFMLTEYFSNYIYNEQDDCNSLRNIYDFIYQLGTSPHPLNQTRMNHYNYYYGLDLAYIRSLIEASSCEDLHKYMKSNFVVREKALQDIAQARYQAVPTTPLSMQIKEKQVVVKNDMEKLKGEEDTFLANWQQKANFLHGKRHQQIQNFIGYYRDTLRSLVTVNPERYQYKADNYHSDRHLAYLLDQYIDTYLKYPVTYDSPDALKLLEQIYAEAIRLHKSTSPRDRMLVIHLEKYYGITLDFVLDVINKSAFPQFIATINQNVQLEKNHIQTYQGYLSSNYQLQHIHTQRLDANKLGSCEAPLLAVLNQKIDLFNADLQSENIYDLSLWVKKVITAGDVFTQNYRDNHAKADYVSSLYDLDRFYLYTLKGWYTTADHHVPNENAQIRLERAYQSILRDFESGHPLRKTRSRHYENHYGISLNKLNEVIEVNKACVPKGQNLVKRSQVQRGETPYIPSSTFAFDPNQYGSSTHIMDAFREKWTLEDKLINTDFEYIQEYNVLREKLANEHPVIDKWKNSDIVKNLDPQKGYYKDQFYITKAYQLYLLNDNEITAANDFCTNITNGVVKSGAKCADYQFLTDADFDRGISVTNSALSIKPKQPCFGLSHEELQKILVAGLCCSPKAFPTPPTVSFTTAFAKVPEDHGKYTVTIQLSNDFPQAVEIPLTIGGSAVQGRDYTAFASTTLKVPAKQTSIPLVIDLLDDTERDWDQRLVIKLGDPVNGKSNPSTNTFILTIIDNDNTLEKRAKERLDQLFSGYSGNHIEIVPFQPSDLPASLSLKGRDGYLFTVRLKELQKKLLFDIGKYYIEDKRMRGGSMANQKFELYRNAMEEFNQVALGILDSIGHKVADPYQIFLIGGADKRQFKGATPQLSPAYNNYSFTHIPVIPFDFATQEYQWGTQVERIVGSNSYKAGTRNVTCNHPNTEYCNADLYYLRSAFIHYMMTDFFEIEPERVQILQGFVSDRVSYQDMNCLIFMEINPAIIGK